MTAPSNVQSVLSSGLLPRVKDQDRTEVTLGRTAPKYAERELDLILRFLAASTITAERSLKSCIALAKGDDIDSPRSKLLYHWQKMRAAIEWLAWMSQSKQKHLLVFDDSQITDRMNAWKEKYRLSFVREPSGKSASTTLDVEESILTGDTQPNMPPENSGT